MVIRNFLVLLLVLVAVVSCADKGNGTDDRPNFDVSQDQETGDLADDTGGPVPTQVDEAFKVAFLYMGRLGSKYMGRTDLFVMDSKDPNPVNITGDRDWSCADGCVLDPDFKALGVFKAPDNPDDKYLLRIYPLGHSMKP